MFAAAPQPQKDQTARTTIKVSVRERSIWWMRWNRASAIVWMGLVVCASKPIIEYMATEVDSVGQSRLTSGGRGDADSIKPRIGAEGQTMRAAYSR